MEYIFFTEFKINGKHVNEVESGIATCYFCEVISNIVLVNQNILLTVY